MSDPEKEPEVWAIAGRDDGPEGGALMRSLKNLKAAGVLLVVLAMIGGRLVGSACREGGVSRHCFLCLPNTFRTLVRIEMGG